VNRESSVCVCVVVRGGLVWFGCFTSDSLVLISLLRVGMYLKVTSGVNERFLAAVHGAFSCAVRLMKRGRIEEKKRGKTLRM